MTSEELPRKSKAILICIKNLEAPHEVPGPTEVPGPYEVTLDQWRTIVAGQRISIRPNGTFATIKFDPTQQLDAFIEKNPPVQRWRSDGG